MPNIIDNEEIRNSISLMSVDFYHSSSDLGWIDENTELLRGIPVQKMSKSPLHEYLVGLCLDLITAVLPGGYLVFKERPLTTIDSEPEPDLMVVQGSRSDFRKNHPTTALLVIEVAINTEKRDHEKVSIYAEAGVGEYWMVCPNKKQIIVFSQSNGKEFESIQIFSNGEIQSAVLTGLKIMVPAIFD
jgi:Uma2 family endonuclease